jgi:hypothetical protein
VGPAWARCRGEHPEVELYAPDESHASAAGSYLAACCFCAALSGESPGGLPGRIESNGDVLVDLDEITAAALQHAAQEP